MEYCALLRGVMPTGKNRIPKMALLVDWLEEAGLQQVRTYIQSGNILLETDLSPNETASLIHQIIWDKLGADLAVILKTKGQLEMAVAGNPFDQEEDPSRVHLTFTDEPLATCPLENLENWSLEGEKLAIGEECFYLYLPRDAAKKRLQNNALEKKLRIRATTRKWTVVKALVQKMR